MEIGEEIRRIQVGEPVEAPAVPEPSPDSEPAKEPDPVREPAKV